MERKCCGSGWGWVNFPLPCRSLVCNQPARSTRPSVTAAVQTADHRQRYLQLRLGRQRQGSYRLRMNAWVAGNTVRSFTTRAIPQRFCDEVAS